MNEPAVNLENKLKVSLILTPELNTVWKDCEQILKKSCKRSDGRVRTVDIYYRIARNLSQLWIIFDDDDLSIVSCLVTNIHTYPTGLKMLNIEHIAGKKMGDWIDQGLDVLYRWSKDNDCHGIEGLGRAGFENWIKDKEGWEQTSKFYQIIFEGDK